MKTKTTFKRIFLALTITLCIASCKKDKKDEPTPTPAEVKAITLTDLKALSTAASVKVPDNKKITGIVISDVSSKNIDSKTVVLQEATGQNGIIITFDAAQTFALGDQLEVVISNQTLAQVNGEIELTNIPAANAKKTGIGTITEKVATAAEIATNKAAWDGTLVSITSTDLTLTGGSGKYTGTLTLTDASGNVTSNVLTGAGFENTAYPVSVSSVTGIVRISGTGARLDIRKTADVSSGAVTRLVTEDFANFSTDTSPYYTPGNLGYGLGFTTAAGMWSVSSGAWYFPGAQFDSDFTAAGRSYVYLLPAYYPLGGTGTASSNFTHTEGLKTVTVTFAGSKMSGNNLFADYTDLGVSELAATKTYSSVLPFEANDYFQIAICPITAGPYESIGNISTSPNDPAALPIIKISTKYTQAGQFYTLTWTVPTKAQLVAAGASEDDATAWLANPQFEIANLSTRKNDTNNNYAPILIDKVVLGF